MPSQLDCGASSFRSQPGAKREQNVRAERESRTGEQNVITVTLVTRLRGSSRGRAPRPSRRDTGTGCARADVPHGRLIPG
eukprot:scaffold54221_cov55-Phaeocystis_antarctica.AAC.4